MGEGVGEVLGVGVAVGLVVGEGDGDGVGEGELFGEFAAYIMYTARNESKQAHAITTISAFLFMFHSEWNARLICFFQYLVVY